MGLQLSIDLPRDEPVYLKDIQKEKYLLSHRCMIALVLVVFLFLVLLTRIAYLQIVRHHFYNTLSNQNRIEVIPIEPIRGLIYDRQGILLAKNIPAFSLDIEPSKIDDLSATIERLRGIIPIDEDELDLFYKIKKQKRKYETIPLKIKLTPEDVAVFSVNKYRFPGVSIQARLLREYPKKTACAHVIGYVGRINEQEAKTIDKANYSASNHIGKTGVEQYNETLLHGTVGYQEMEVDAAGHPIRTLKITPAIPGKNLYLSIDAGLQQLVEDELKGNRGAAVAIDPRNGDVLAMVSEPSFDPNLFVQGIPHQLYQAWQSDPYQPLYNRTLRGLYPPGSTVKPFISINALEQGLIDPERRIYDPGFFKLPFSSHIFHGLHDYKNKVHGWVDMHKAIVESSDTYFYTLAYDIKIAKLSGLLKLFGFGESTGIDLEGEKTGILPTPEWKQQHLGQHWYPGDTINTSIGQGYMLVTPLQLAEATARLAAKGQHYPPRLVTGTQALNKPLESLKPVDLGISPLASEEHWNLVFTAMEGVIREDQGTGFRFGKNTSYRAAGKTGTAQVYSLKSTDPKKPEAEHLQDNALFIAFAPLENPCIAVAIIAEHTTALPPIIARKMFDYYISGNPTACPY